MNLLFSNLANDFVENPDFPKPTNEKESSEMKCGVYHQLLIWISYCLVSTNDTVLHGSTHNNEWAVKFHEQNEKPFSKPIIIINDTNNKQTTHYTVLFHSQRILNSSLMFISPEWLESNNHISW